MVEKIKIRFSTIPITLSMKSNLISDMKPGFMIKEDRDLRAIAKKGKGRLTK